MKYNFDKLINRRGTGALKWDIPEGELPMWVADMDFETAPEIRKVIADRAAHGVFGYNIVPDEWYDAYVSWWRKRHGFELRRERLVFCTGVVPALSAVVRKLTTTAERVLLLTPCYNIFYNSILNNGRVPLECPLKYENNSYHIDFDLLERGLREPQTTMMILCNPHNPVGRIWSKKELMRIGELCAENNVIVVSDEIHCDLTAPGKSYVPFASVSELCRDISVTCIAPTKAFNLAGLQTAAVYAENGLIYNRVVRALNTDEVAEPNSFAVTAAVAAFTQGAPWLDALREYIEENRRIVAEYVNKEIPDITYVPSEATYLLWLYCGSLCGDSTGLAEFVRRKTGLYLSAGSGYGAGGEAFLRLNIACPRESVLDGLKRLKDGINGYKTR
ncbi:MAG: pyridoxal phosphate-dependent aminotransferase [Clostridia bacterium]|nr:pyridoxal phosphate-dependent aminotransferase [Clostridia bacterium]